MRKYLLAAWLFCIPGAAAFAQVDTSGIDGERADSLDAASVWGPLMGGQFYAGIRMTIWK